MKDDSQQHPGNSVSRISIPNGSHDPKVNLTILINMKRKKKKKINQLIHRNVRTSRFGNAIKRAFRKRKTNIEQILD